MMCKSLSFDYIHILNISTYFYKGALLWYFTVYDQT